MRPYCSSHRLSRRLFIRPYSTASGSRLTESHISEDLGIDILLRELLTSDARHELDSLTDQLQYRRGVR